MKTFISLALFTSVSLFSHAQARSYSDAAQMYNRMLLERENTVVKIGNYKVRGTPYFYGGRLMGKLFMQNGNATFTFVSFNTYDQNVEYSEKAAAESPILKPVGFVDSFMIAKNTDLEISNDLFFINGKHLHVSDNGFYLKVFNGVHYSLFKKYKSELGIVSTNYIEAELRQFDLEYEYFYFDTTTNSLKKLKPNLNFFKKEFKGTIDVNQLATNDDFSYRPESTLIKIFEALNSL